MLVRLLLLLLLLLLLHSAVVIAAGRSHARSQPVLRVFVDALLAHQFADVPGTRTPDAVTRLEEEKICAYYGAGTLYATPLRAEPLL